MENAPAVIDAEYKVINFEDYAMSTDGVIRQVKLIQEVMAKTMKDNEHYGVIPGCGKKPSLLKPGAEKLCMTFRLAPYYEIKKSELPKNHREYEIVCTLKHISTGVIVGQGVGSCSTMEGKFRFRTEAKICPECGVEAIIKGKKEYGGGWLCFKKKNGCGAKWNDGDPAIEDQADGKSEHDNPADYYNTVLKMAKKRAHVDAVLTATAASDIFTQDIEDMPEVIVPKAEPASKAKTEKPKTEPKPSKTETPKEDKPFMKSQADKIIEFAHHELGLTEGEAKAVIEWYLANNDHGGRTYKAGQALINGFMTIYARYNKVMMEAEPEPHDA